MAKAKDLQANVDALKTEKEELSTKVGIVLLFILVVVVLPNYQYNYLW